jgi:regulator of protease activity HflC (stomatin/prohibitin superfamily)
VPLQGSKADKTEYTIVYGRVWYNNFFDDIYVFPTFMQQVAWVKSTNEGSPIDESISFSSKEGKSVNCDVSLAYSIEADAVPRIFREQKKRIEDITANYLRSKVREAFSRNAGKMEVHDILGAGKSDLVDAVKKDLVEELGPKGYLIDMVAIISDPRVDVKVSDAINAAIAAQIKAVEAKNKVQQIEAESEQKIAEARGKAESIRMVAEADAEANRKIGESLTPQIIQYQMIKAWNGVPPMVLGGDVKPLLNVEAFAKPVTTK